MNVGDRVGAVLGGDENEVQFLGYGVYEGEFTPEEAVGFLADALKEAGRKNPRIKLDNGKIVYGCECWWGGEERVKKMLEQYKKVVDVDIDEVREEVKNEILQPP